MFQTLYMQRCFELAQKGIGRVNPNPLVGSVIVHDNRIIGEGYHKVCGGAHAEVHAIASVEDKEKLKKSTLYVNLEPCSHHGKTPPCADLIIKMQIPKVVISCADPNPSVNGEGVATLRHAGIEVVEHYLEKEGREVNRRFFTNVEKKRPYIILKWAQSRDGYMDIDRQTVSEFKGSYRITDEYLRILDHLWRSQEDAIMVGSQTLLIDNPRLNTRCFGGRNPVRVSIDRRGRLSRNLHFFDSQQKSILFTNDTTCLKSSGCDDILYFSANERCDIKEILHTLHTQKIGSLIVEGGRQVLTSFIESGIWDEARVFIGNIHIKQGLQAPILPANLLQDSVSSFFPSDIYPKIVNGQNILYFKNDVERYL